MPREDDQKPKRRPGRPTYRTFHDKIGFRVATTLHLAMKLLASEKNVRQEEVYTEAIKYFISMREHKDIVYTAPPLPPLSSRVTVPMEPNLAATARTIMEHDRQPLSDVFQTAVRAYLTHLGRLPP